MVFDSVNDRKPLDTKLNPAATETVVPPQATSPTPVPEDAALDHPALYFNRELGDIDFNWRVLCQAIDERTPLLERVRFVAITASNMDEFFQKRVGGLKRQEAAGVPTLSPDGLSPTEQLELIREAARIMYGTMDKLWETLRLALREAGITVSDYEALSPAGQSTVRAYFRSTVYPILTPLAVDPGRPFPFISSLSLSLAVTLRHEQYGTRHFVRLKVPVGRGRWLRVEEDHFVPIEQVIAHHVGELFPGMAVEGAHLFRVTRNADVRRDEEEAEDLLAVISEELRERRFAPLVRLEVERAMPPHVRHYLLQQLKIGEEDLFEVAGTLNLSHCAELAECPRPDLSFAPWQPVVPKRLLPTDTTGEAEDIFAVLKAGDLLVHHPYELFEASVQRLIAAAA
ncbi:MAG: polyphosphate kinase 1, partial [Deinococcota bacterium]|nr:polyphosphate kinase 1 [Deinococcota bacterium]